MGEKGHSLIGGPYEIFQNETSPSPQDYICLIDELTNLWQG